MWLEWVVMKSTFIYQQSLNENDKTCPTAFQSNLKNKNNNALLLKVQLSQGSGSEGYSSFTGSEYSLAENSMKSEPCVVVFFLHLPRKITKHLVSLLKNGSNNKLKRNAKRSE